MRDHSLLCKYIYIVISWYVVEMIALTTRVSTNAIASAATGATIHVQVYIAVQGRYHHRPRCYFRY